MVNMLSVDKYLKKAKVSIIKGNISEAETFYKLILQNYPENKRAKEGLAKINNDNRYNYNGIEENISNLIKLYNAREYKKTLLLGHQLYLKYSNESIIPNILGAANAAVGNFEKAIVLYENSLKLKPLNPHVYNNLGLTYKELKDFKSAIKSFKEAIKIKPDFSEAYNNLGLTYKEINNIDEAIINLDKAIFIKKEYSEAIYNKANLLNEIENYEEAINLYIKATKINPNYYNAYNNQGTAEMNFNKDSNAIKSFKKAIKVNPTFIDAYSNLCHLFEQSNNIVELEKTLEKIKQIKIDENDEIKYRFAQLFARKHNYKKSIKLLEDINDKNISQKIQIAKYTLLGKNFDKIKNFNSAFKNFKIVNLIMKNESVKNNIYHPNIYQNEINELTKSYSKTKKIKWNNLNYNNKKDKEPIFLIGFPRSGTTLLDNILASHPEIITVEEKPMIHQVKLKLKSLPTYENLSKLQFSEINDLRSIYNDELKKHIMSDSELKYIIDKLPLNIVEIGLIIRMFPNAKFILSLRHPCDCVLSCFMQTFKINNSMANFLTLKDSANLYNMVMKLFEIYEKKFNLNYHIIKYEELITDLKTTTSDLLESLNLDWNDNLENYQKTASTKRIKTPSYSQVTEKLYSRAKGRWENYKSEMNDILPILEYWISKWNY